MNKCKDCKWFRKNEDPLYKRQHNMGYCKNDDKFRYSMDVGDETDWGIDGLVYGDYEGYSAYFEVGQEFGCIHWKQKER